MSINYGYVLHQKVSFKMGPFSNPEHTHPGNLILESPPGGRCHGRNLPAYRGSGLSHSFIIGLTTAERSGGPHWPGPFRDQLLLFDMEGLPINMDSLSADIADIRAMGSWTSSAIFRNLHHPMKRFALKTLISNSLSFRYSSYAYMW